MYRYIDVHSHVALDVFDEGGEDVFRAMKEEGIGTIVVGVDRETSQQAAQFAHMHENVWATVGIHPEDGKEEAFDEQFYASLLTEPKVVAVGECGLDYYRLEQGEASQRKEEQKRLFARQIELAVAHDRPLMLHGRPLKGTMDAYEDMLALLATYKERYAEKLRGNVHFFVGTPEIAKRFIDLNFSVSFTGVVTFTGDYDAVVKAVPQGMIHAETDSPYATPVPHRGKRNDPRYVPLIVARLAAIRGETEEGLQVALLRNAERVFGLKL